MPYSKARTHEPTRRTAHARTDNTHAHTHTHTPQAKRTQAPHSIHTSTRRSTTHRPGGHGEGEGPPSITQHTNTRTQHRGRGTHTAQTQTPRAPQEGPQTTHHTPQRTRRTPHTTNKHGTQATTTSSRPRQGVAGSYTKSPQQGMVRDLPLKPAANPSQQWRGTAPVTQTDKQTTPHQHTPTHHKHRQSTTLSKPTLPATPPPQAGLSKE